MNRSHEGLHLPERPRLCHDKDGCRTRAPQNTERNARLDLAQDIDAVNAERTAYMHCRVSARQHKSRDLIQIGSSKHIGKELGDPLADLLA